MAVKSEISWTDATFNPWIGCTKVGLGCDHCYAERDNGRRKWVAGWGPGVPRRRTKTWGDPVKWNADPRRIIGDEWPARRPRVFAASLADIFDNEVPDEWRADFWQLVKATPNLDWLIVTKRIGNAKKMLPPDWGNGYPNVVLIITTVNQDELGRDGPKLSATPAARRGLSIEPMIGRMTLTRCWPDMTATMNLLTGEARHLLGDRGKLPGIDWVIAGGESGPQCRPIDPDWVRSLRDECAAANVAFHFKQWGGVSPKDGGRLLDGREHNGFPPPPTLPMSHGGEE